jgi:starvation-inducible DNA-binding protein
MKELIQKLNREVANFGLLYTKLHNFHWYVKGMSFYQLHQLFEKLYDESTETMDALAERILMLEGKPFATLREFLANSSLKEASGNETVMEMINQTIYDFTTIDGELAEIIKTAQNLGDEVTVDLILGIQGSIQKHLWMLKALEK